MRKDLRRKESSIWQINRDFYQKNSKSQTSLRRCIKNGVSETRKSFRKVSKTQSSDEFKSC